VVRAVQDLQGTVVSTGMNKSVTVKVERLAQHKKYAKRVRLSKNYIAHNETIELGVGDYVRLEGCRPLSKTKRFTVAEVIRKAD
jgi:small subunit ribosomal protein S17